MAINLIKIGREYSSPSHKEFVMDSASDVANLPTLSDCAPGSFATVIGGDKYILKPSGKWAVHNDATASASYDDTELRQLIANEGTAREAADAGKADTEHTHTVSQITDFPNIPEGWTELMFEESTLEEAAAAWPRCCLKLNNKLTSDYYYAMPYGSNGEGLYCFAAIIDDAFTGFTISQDGWNSFGSTLVYTDWLKEVAYSGSYNDLTDKPTIPNTAYELIKEITLETDTSQVIETFDNDYTDVVVIISTTATSNDTRLYFYDKSQQWNNGSGVYCQGLSIGSHTYVHASIKGAVGELLSTSTAASGYCAAPKYYACTPVDSAISAFATYATTYPAGSVFKLYGIKK